MKFDQLVEYNMRNNNLIPKFGRETIAKLLSKKIKIEHISGGYLWINSFKVLCCLFLLYAKLRAIKIYWN